MAANKLEITSGTKVHELLMAYPELEDVLIGIAPPFKKLKNPFLRRSVAKVATLKHVSAVGDVPLEELVNTLRKAVGQSPSSETYDDENYFLEQPDWFSTDRIAVSIEEAKLEDKDRMTLVVVMKAAQSVKQGEIIELVTTFLPAPGIDTLKAKGYSAWTQKAEGNIVKTYFLKNDD